MSASTTRHQGELIVSASVVKKVIKVFAWLGATADATRLGHVLRVSAPVIGQSGILAPAAGARQWAQVSAGPLSTCAVQTGHTLWCWGAGVAGELGDGSTASQDTPARVGRRVAWTQVAVGTEHACAVRKDGTAWCWGDGVFGALGNGTTGQQDRPVQVAGGGYTAVATGKRPDVPPNQNQ